jgi:Predicted membrane protein
MPQEILILAWGAVLLMVQIFLAGHLKTKQYGADWNIGARDKPMPPLQPLPARARRAQDNMAETFPVAIVALAGLAITGRGGDVSVVGGWLWLAMRVIYVPVYLIGIKGLRTIIFLISIAGLLMALWPLLVI